MSTQSAYDSSQRRFAESIVRRIVEQHHIAYFAGGCVRDNLLGIPPSDYDIATSATPEQVRGIFGQHRTLFVGAAFGVVCVHQRIDSILHQVEVATFRSDGDYSDGRRPDRVEYTTPEGDAQRRDFTINGLFYDPIAGKVIDFVNGQKDLDQRILRAIGDAHARFSEDKLRLLRAVRIAARFGFQIEAKTASAIAAMAPEIQVVSPERSAAEMRKMLVDPSRTVAIQLLDQFGLLHTVFPELSQVYAETLRRGKTQMRLSRLAQEDFVAALALLCYSALEHEATSEYISTVKQMTSNLKSRWRLSNEDAAALEFSLASAPVLFDAEQAKWSALQPILVSPFVNHALNFVSAVLFEANDHDRLLDRCKAALTLPPNELDPPPFVDGKLLISLGLPTGPEFARLIKLARIAQLDGELRTHQEASNWARQHCKPYL